MHLICSDLVATLELKEAAVWLSLCRQNANARVYHKQNNCLHWGDESQTKRTQEAERPEAGVECWPLKWGKPTRVDAKVFCSR